ncbi:LiaI-LiaF-like domain-containing protein [Mucilaginibacter lacusdianchii]|uniref:LiaI-LiaF-like domain-containing protein n=1 Tax=Mucilaginibacter lacusdianchii TaxID=2684211 RepID=UPI00131AC7F5|nr:DUF5668 domain-containing protein [Mucilaginibacter sp. JXJ CY 39]
MRNNRLFSGIVLVLIGTIFLMNNFGVINFHWSNVVYLWPVFLVIAGANMLLANNRAIWATVVRVLIIVGGFSLILFSNLGEHHNRFFNFHYNTDDNDSDDNDDNENVSLKDAKQNTYQQVYSPDVKLVRLNISGGATTYKLTDTTADLFKADAREYGNRFNLTTEKTDSVTVLNFDMNSHVHGRERNFRWNNGRSNSADIKLNNAPQWEINVKGGATEVDFDLSPYKVKDLRLEGGAASYKVKLGANLPVTMVDVSTGVSEIELLVPRNVACDVTTSSALSSTDFEGMDKVGDKHYTSPGFSTAKNKIYINFKGGISEFNVKRY